ncbi:hypothetical protein ES288_A06G075100v1 [Gossypium darwinii]|nr:hypothetical protein ES288_A06G075100v1 [Gossypium darwinii]TYI21954.1 hypothetical protein ES332_A06G073700v1 [Gossypium tomentosum]
MPQPLLPHLSLFLPLLNRFPRIKNSHTHTHALLYNLCSHTNTNIIIIIPRVKGSRERKKTKMCHANIPCGGKPALLVQRSWFLLQASMVAADHHSPRVARGTGGSTGSMKWCMCSPTKHPGSFRCRHHHADYVWGGRFITKK